MSNFLKEESETVAYTTNFNSSSFEMRDSETVGIQMVLTGTASGSVVVQVSNDNTNFIEYSGSSQTLADNGKFFWSIANNAAKFVRISATCTGTGDAAFNVIGKGQ